MMSLRKRRTGAEAAESKAVNGSENPLDVVIASLALPSSQGIVDGIMKALPAVDVVRLQQTATEYRGLCAELRPRALQARGYDRHWTWQQANSLESASFHDLFNNLGTWAPGPNEKSECNVMETSTDSTADWLNLSGGTDWQGFQGGFRLLDEAGLRPRWVSFQVRIDTPELSGAFLSFASHTHTWGLAEPVLSFSYRGDERREQPRCFSVQVGATQFGDVPHYFCPHPEVVPGRAYAIAVELDWQQKCMSVYIDGTKHVHQVAFKPAGSIRFAAVYNWRSQARTAFSQLILGDSRPHPVKQVDADSTSASSNGRAKLLQICPCRRRSTKQRDHTLQPMQWLRVQMITPAVLVLAAALHFASQA